MGRGLSELQRDVLRVLQDFPAVGRAELEARAFTVKDWARPADIIAALARVKPERWSAPTPSARVTLSKSLLGLYMRGLVSAWAASGGAPRAYRYALIADAPESGGNTLGEERRAALSDGQ